MLTVDYRRLGLRGGERVLDLGCGGGRHAFEALRRGARVVALDASRPELEWAGALMASMLSEGQAAGGAAGSVVQADALVLPFASASFDRVIAAEVLEHIPADTRAIAELARVLRPGGVLAVTVPRFGPEAINWALSRQYHDKEGGHVRIYRRSSLLARLRRAGLRPLGSHHAHALHSPYWWLRCAVGVDREDHRLVRAYRRFLEWDISARPALTGALDRALNPVLGKSLVVYAEKAA
ncbi:MAG TPA: class I SAM-dependent methyltransferase [Acidimicrobiales bacterium]|nr:class I SAM-dependent methyltransferase [Acidimicrobiales bacterium]